MSTQTVPTAGSTATQPEVDFFRQTFDRLVENIDRAILGRTTSPDWPSPAC